MSSKNINEFYMVLPSNSSPQTHPRNIAAEYIVGWDSPIELDPNENWKVALTEASYIYHPHTISSNLSIEYERFETVTTSVKHILRFKIIPDGNIEFVLHSSEPTATNNANLFPDTKLKFNIIENKFLGITGNQLFSIIDETKFGIQGEAKDLENGRWHLNGTRDLHELLTSGMRVFGIDIEINVLYYAFKPVVRELKFPSDKLFATVPALFTYLREHCKEVFTDISSTTTGAKRMIFTMANKVFRVKFNGGINFVLGFYESEFKMVNPSQLKTLKSATNISSYQADVAPQMNRGVKNMYIYASCCAPVYVGHTRVPLLKNIFVDASQDANIHGHVRNIAVQNPMYVNVAASTMNSIEINIRNDAGNIIGFPKGSITVLTLHFKKFTK